MYAATKNTLEGLVVDGLMTGTTHIGASVQRMVEHYAQNEAACGELVQNAIDVAFGGAKHIAFVIDFDKDSVIYYDNGIGLPLNVLHSAINSIGMSSKKNDKYGKYGIGMTAFLSICERFYMTTAPSGEQYMKVEFDSARLFGTATGKLPFPTSVAKEVFHDDKKTPGSAKWSSTVWWRTRVEVLGLTKDKVKRAFDLTSFRETIQTAYSQKMSMLGTSIKVEVVESGVRKEMTFSAKLYEGKPLPAWSVEQGAAGKVQVNFYLAPIGYKGNLRMGFGSSDNPSRVPIQKLFLSPFMQNLDQMTRDALKSGMFQGEVICDGLVMKVDRANFERNEAQEDLTLVLDKWYQEVGKKYFEDEKRKRLAGRYQKIGLEAIGQLGDILETEGSSPFASLFARATYGTIGKGHTAPPKSTVVPGPGMMAKAYVDKGKREGGDSQKGGSCTSGGFEKPAHSPNVVIGPDGSVRKVVKGHSTGFHILVEDIGRKLWSFDPQALCLKINPTHPLFEEVEKSDSKLRDLYVAIALTSFRIASLSAELQQGAQVFAEGYFEDWVRRILKK